MKKFMKQYGINFILIFTIAGIALYFSMRDHFDEIVESLRNANIFIVILMLLLMVVFYLLEGRVLSIFGKIYYEGYTWIKGISNALIGGLFNNITPFASGGQFAQAYIFVKQGLKGSAAASVLMLNFIVYQSTMVVFSFLLLLFNFTKYLDNFSSLVPFILLGFIVNVIVLAGLIGASLSTKFHHFISNVIIKGLSKVKIVKDYEASKTSFNQQLELFKRELRLLSSRKDILIKVVIINVIKLFIIYSMPFFAYRALGFDISIVYIYDIIAMTATISMITAFIPIPGSSGGAEGAYMLIFPVLFKDHLEMATVAAASTMILWRIVTFYWVTIIGGFTFVFSKSSNKDEIMDLTSKNKDR